jgi:hypothetical protein
MIEAGQKKIWRLRDVYSFLRLGRYGHDIETGASQMTHTLTTLETARAKVLAEITQAGYADHCAKQDLAYLNRQIAKARS